MAVSSRGGRMTTTELQIPKRWKERSETSPERTKVWTEPPPKHLKSKERKVVSVVYYLSRNGQLEHPHFMEVTLSPSSEGLYLRDVINRLNLLRGNGMASMYSWSSKRSYKNGFVWHDLAENDFIYPAHGQEYVLKGSELLLLLDGPSATSKSHETASSSTSKKSSPETHKSGDDSEFPMVVSRRRNQSWSSIDLQEYKVYKTESTGESIGKSAAADASTQTDDKRRRRKAIIKEEEEDEEVGERKSREPYENHSVELSREEISPPPSDSSPETLETLMKADGRLVLCSGTGGNEDDVPNRTASNNCPSGRMKASSVLMQLISCGAVSFKDCGAMAVKDQGLSLISHYKARFPRGAGNHSGKDVEAALMENPGFAGLSLEDKEYFSGSLIETKKDVFPSLKRSSSYNADRSSQMDLAMKEIDGVRAKCIPRKSKTLLIKKEAIIGIACNGSASGGGGGSCSSQHGSKRLEVQQ